jgi:hypothetical protein
MTEIDLTGVDLCLDDGPPVRVLSGSISLVDRLVETTEVIRTAAGEMTMVFHMTGEAVGLLMDYWWRAAWYRDPGSAWWED